KIPAHWEVKRLRHIFKEVSIKKCGNEQQLCATQSYGVIPKKLYSYKTVEVISGDLNSFKLVKKDNFVISLRSFEGGIEHSNYQGIISPAYTILEPQVEIYSFYFKFLFKSSFFISTLNIHKIGIREGQNISYASLQYTPIPLPPLQKQKEIAEFLDSKCEKIQNYIDKKQKLITLLQEKKQALINEAVTKGLNPNIEFKNSGIDYLGLIPHHWEVKKLKYVGKVVLGKMLCNEHQKGYSHCYYLKSKNLQWLNVEVSQIEKMWFSEYEKSLYRIKKDDLLVSEGGEVGKTCIWNNELAECYIQNSVHKITLNKFNNAKFFLYLFFTYGKLGVFDSVVSRVSIAHLVLEKLVNVDMVVPPLQEQKQIANFLDEKCEKINSAIEKTKRQITLIKEYKNTLINEAVCGRIR
ncbi:hypothetical protein YZ58_06445, partial [Campylobacter upsaliensis]|nr:hypothetical protein [Campylobacter upsaliensis]